jgi:hypothetical protein
MHPPVSHPPYLGLPFCRFLLARQPVIAHRMEHVHGEGYDVGSFDPYLRAACSPAGYRQPAFLCRSLICTICMLRNTSTLQEEYRGLPSIDGSHIWQTISGTHNHAVSTTLYGISDTFWVCSGGPLS